MKARKFAPATTKSKCISMDGSNLIGVGHRFGPDQNGAPDEVSCNNKILVGFTAI